MRQETYAKKLAALLGLDETVVEKAAPVVSDPHVQKRKAKEVKARNRRFDLIEEENIQEFRAAQGMLYFLQAPALFSPKICRHCGASFLVSRQSVGYCSYTCIKNSLAELGIDWEKGRDIEALVNDPQVFDGNEPLWVKNLDNLKTALEVLCQVAQDQPTSD